jgi:hypothetical protein
LIGNALPRPFSFKIHKTGVFKWKTIKLKYVANVKLSKNFLVLVGIMPKKMGCSSTAKDVKAIITKKE